MGRSFGAFDETCHEQFIFSFIPDDGLVFWEIFVIISIDYFLNTIYDDLSEAKICGGFLVNTIESLF